MIFIIGFIRTYIPQKKLKNLLSKSKNGVGNIIASLFGAVTPFCSCSSIPIFVSFLKTGVPLSVTFSFLITSPLVNEYLVVLMLGFFGWKITIAYVLAGILIGVTSGIILGKMKLEKNLSKDLFSRYKKNTIKEIKDLFKKSILELKDSILIYKFEQIFYFPTECALCYISLKDLFKKIDDGDIGYELIGENTIQHVISLDNLDTISDDDEDIQWGNQ